MKFRALPVVMILTVASGALGVAWETADPDESGRGAISSGAPYVMHRASVDGGSMAIAGGGYTLSGTIAQPDAGQSFGGTYELHGGFWFPVLPGDAGEDGDVDLTDFAAFELCATGPSALGPDAACRVFDVNHSETVDLVDFAEIQMSYTGP